LVRGGAGGARRSLGARWHGWARTTRAEGDSHGIGELVDALLDLDAGLHVEGEVLGIGANLDGDAAGTRDAGDARGHLGALDGLRWKRMEKEKSAAALFFSANRRSLASARGTSDDVSSRDARDADDVFTFMPKVSRRVGRKRALGSSPEARFPRSRSRFEAARSTVVAGKATR
jgi:hypothetical protein